jgi:hypothetical protein
MTYFSKLPLTTYELNSNTTVVRDILTRVAFISEYKPYSDLYNNYFIMDGETPQSVALKFYKSTSYHWVVLLFNEIHNPLFDWPLNQLTLTNRIIDFYGEAVANETRHYEMDGVIVGEYKEFKQGITWIPPENPGVADNLEYTNITFMDYENRLNDEKRVIKIMRPELLGDFVAQFEESMNG